MRRLMLTVAVLALVGCSTLGSSAEQLKELAKIKNAGFGCARVGTPYGNGVIAFADADKGVVGEMVVDCDGLKMTIRGPAAGPGIILTPNRGTR